VLTSTENTIESPKTKIGKDGKPIVTTKTMSKVFSNKNLDKEEAKKKDGNEGNVAGGTDSKSKM